MENATKALLMAAGVLIGIMVLSLGVALYSELDSYVETSHERIRFNELNTFNTRFSNYVNYAGNKKKFDLLIQDIVTVASLAYENNLEYNASEEYRGNESTLYVAIYLNGTPIEGDIHNRSTQLLTENIGKTYKCRTTKYKSTTDIKYSEETGRVYEMYFWEE